MLLEVKCKVSTVSDDLGCHVICWCWSTVFSEVQIYQEILEHFMLPSADKLYGDADFIFQEDLAPAHTAKGTKSWFNDHGVTVLDWPANSPELNPIENLWGIVKGIWETESIEFQHSKPKMITQMNSVYTPQSLLDRDEHTFQKANNSLKWFFLLVLWSIPICWDSELWVFVKCEPKSSQLKEQRLNYFSLCALNLLNTRVHNFSWITEINELFHDILI